MIYLDVDLMYLTEHFDVGTKRLQDYGQKSIDEIMDKEAEQGNVSAAKFDLEVLNDPDQLIKVFKLLSPRNRYKILRNMSEEDLKYIMQFLDQKDLIMGLNFFSRDKLVDLIQDLPKQTLALVIFSKMPVQKFLEMLPEKELDNYFESTKVQQNQDKFVEALRYLPQASLEKLMENVTGEPADNANKQTILDTVGSLNPKKFKKAMQSLDKKSKMKVIQKATEEDPKLLLEFSKDAFMCPIKQMDKNQMIKYMDVLENEDLIKMVSELPQDLMSVVATQIDPEEFADLLCTKFQDVLKDVAIG